METMRTVVLPLEPNLSLEEANKAYRMVSEVAFEKNMTSRYALQKLTYSEVRASTKLTAQMTCSVIRRVAAAYKAAKSKGRKLDTPIRFSKRCLDLEGGARGRDFRLYPEKSIVSISTVCGRRKLPYRIGRFQRSYLEDSEWRVRNASLVYRRRKKGWRYELHVSFARRVEHIVDTSSNVLGVDTGRRYLAVATTGRDACFFEARHLKPKKEHYRRLRGRLKSKGTRSSTRAYYRVSGREARLTKDFQHCTAKALVALARDKKCGAIAVERLSGIRERTGARGKRARYHHGTWAYSRFLKILRYKAESAGLEVIEINPANTSRGCSRCGCVHKASRSGLSFTYAGCGYALHSDLNAAKNIRLRAILARQALRQDGPTRHAAPKPDQPIPASCLLQLTVHDGAKIAARIP